MDERTFEETGGCGLSSGVKSELGAGVLIELSPPPGEVSPADERGGRLCDADPWFAAVFLSSALFSLLISAFESAFGSMLVLLFEFFSAFGSMLVFESVFGLMLVLVFEFFSAFGSMLVAFGFVIVACS